MKISGNVHKYGSNVDTDVIIPARYLNEPDHKALASHCMEDIDADFAKKVQPGDIMVADWNFGCGSSREHAPIAIKASGISVVIASSFARIFYRNCINIGLKRPRGLQQEIRSLWILRPARSSMRQKGRPIMQLHSRPLSRGSLRPAAC